jgi:hypothetical protein
VDFPEKLHLRSGALAVLDEVYEWIGWAVSIAFFAASRPVGQHAQQLVSLLS